MGWLFAVARGLQQGKRRAVVESLVFIAFGHESSVTLVAAIASVLALVAAPEIARIVGAVALISFGAFKLVKPGVHPRWVGMRVTRLDLVLWSFLMSTAHGAGLMLFPILLLLPTAAIDRADSLPDPTLTSTLLTDVLAVAVHTVATVVVMGVVALIVYDKFGLSILRRAWVNLDVIWAAAVLGAGVLTFVA